ncbi:MAG TPA: histidine kinase [Burkholderiales bacterium]|nr:histidine kinase [Burkholderiales bacterium]
MRSINQNFTLRTLPNFRNLGVLLRIVLLVNGACLIAAALKSASVAQTLREFTTMGALAEPVLAVSLLMLMLANPWLGQLNYYLGAGLVLILESAITLLIYYFGIDIYGQGDAGPWRYELFSVLLTASLLIYFDLRNRALSPALSEARLQALQARIRPHFLFNSINAVLSLIRSDTKRAEIALEDLADLYRVLMADSRELSTMRDEVDLCRRYLSLEELRLGGRLQVEWHIDNMPEDAKIPPLVLQPLLENAVYHGIEPRTEPGVISINIYLSNNQVHAVLRNPYRRDGGHHVGNKMAVQNIRERLSLHFDVEASFTATERSGSYEVHIVIPYLRAEK